MSPPDRSQSDLRLPPISAAAEGSLYAQIVEAIKREVAAGRLLPGAALPSFRALAEDLLVSVITVKRAYEELEREGIIFCRQGLGTFVAEDGATRNDAARRARAAQRLAEALAEARETGLTQEEIGELVKQPPKKGDRARWKPRR